MIPKTKPIIPPKHSIKYLEARIFFVNPYFSSQVKRVLGFPLSKIIMISAPIKLKAPQ
jgi:hypothetical protein